MRLIVFSILIIQVGVLAGFFLNRTSDHLLPLLGYHRFGGTKTMEDDYNTLFTTMRLNGMIDHPRMLTGTGHPCRSLLRRMPADELSHSVGFIPNAAALRAVAQVAEELRNKEPDKQKFIYVLDRECLLDSTALSATG